MQVFWRGLTFFVIAIQTCTHLNDNDEFRVEEIRVALGLQLGVRQTICRRRVEVNVLSECMMYHEGLGSHGLDVRLVIVLDSHC